MSGGSLLVRQVAMAVDDLVQWLVYIVVDTVDVSGEIGMAGLYQNDGHPGQVILFSIINVVMRGKVLIEKFSQRNSPSMPIQRLVPGT